VSVFDDSWVTNFVDVQVGFAKKSGKLLKITEKLPFWPKNYPKLPKRSSIKNKNDSFV